MQQTPPVHDPQHLLADILGSAQGTSLDEVLVAPRVGELVVLPGVVDSQQGQVVTFRLVELGFFLVSECLLVLRQKKQVNISVSANKCFSLDVCEEKQRKHMPKFCRLTNRKFLLKRLFRGLVQI